MFGALQNPLPTFFVPVCVLDTKEDLSPFHSPETKVTSCHPSVWGYKAMPAMPLSTTHLGSATRPLESLEVAWHRYRSPFRLRGYNTTLAAVSKSGQWQLTWVLLLWPWIHGSGFKSLAEFSTRKPWQEFMVRVGQWVFDPQWPTVVGVKSCVSLERWYPLVILHSYGKSPFLMGKSTISIAIFNSKLLVYQRVPWSILKQSCRKIIWNWPPCSFRFEALKGAHLTPTRISYNSAITACDEHWALAIYFLNAMMILDVWEDRATSSLQISDDMRCGWI